MNADQQRGLDLAARVVKYAETRFVQVITGEPLAYYVGNDETRHAFVTYIFGHRGTQDRREELQRLMAGVLDRLKAHGAQTLVWRTLPHFAYDVTAKQEGRTTHFRMRCVALNAKGATVILPQQEGETFNGAYLKDLELAEPAVHTDPEPTVSPRDSVSTFTTDDPEVAAAYADVTEQEVLAPGDVAILLCARICHEVTKALNDSVNELTLPWDDAKASAVSGVKFALDYPSAGPEHLHAKWLADKEAAGWVYGPTKDPVARTHPCMVPYTALPAAQRVKDVVFRSIVRTFFGLGNE
jgi:hypothetical protein